MGNPIHPLHQIGGGLLSIWKNVHEIQADALRSMGAELPQGWQFEVAAADVASMAIGIHFAPYSKQFRRYLVEYVKDGIRASVGLPDATALDDGFVQYLTSISRAKAAGQDAGSGDVIAREVVTTLGTTAIGLERQLAVRFGMLTQSGKEFVEAIGPTIAEPSDLAPAFVEPVEHAPAMLAEAPPAGGPTFSPAEAFFVAKINDGLDTLEGLTAAELDLLGMSVDSAVGSPSLSRSAAQDLQERCARALTKAYEGDARLRNREVLLEWRERNEQLYRQSRRVLSAMVQEWYLAAGRGQERRAAGCLAVVLVGMVGALLAGAAGCAMLGGALGR